MPGRGQQVTGRLRRHHVTAQQSRLVAASCRHDQLDLDGDRGGSRLTGDALDEGVGHQLPPPAFVTSGARRPGSPLKGGQDRDPLRDGQQRREVGHRVGSRPQTDAAFAVSPARALGHRGRVEPTGERPGPGLDLSVAETWQVCCQGGIDGGAVFGAQAGGLAADDRGPPLTHRPRFEVLHRAGKLADQGFGQAEVPGATARRVPARQRNLRRDALAAHASRQARDRLRLALGLGERRCRPSLGARGGSLDRLQQPDLVDALRVVHASVEGGQARQDLAQVGGGQGSRHGSPVSRQRRHRMPPTPLDPCRTPSPEWCGNPRRRVRQRWDLRSRPSRVR